MKTLEEEIERCSRCGSCKAVCPSYRVQRTETGTARGRLRLVHALETGTVSADRSVVDSLGTCLHCRLCETACPAGVPIQEHLFRGLKRLRGSAFLSSRLLQTFLSGSLLDKAARFVGLAHGVGALPGLSGRRIPRPATIPLRNRQTLFRPGTSRGRVALFTGCSINYLYPQMGEDLIDLLLHLGYEVVLGKGELCCGAPLRELGYDDVYTALAQKNVALFSKMRVEAILSACPTCTLTLRKDYARRLDLPDAFARRIMDVNVFLAERLHKGLRYDGAVRYHDPCHLAVGLGVRDAPRDLIRRTGAELLPGESGCCGFGGLFAFQHADLSRDIGGQALEPVPGNETSVLLTACPGCRMQFEDILVRDRITVMHTVEFLRRALEGVPAGH